MNVCISRVPEEGSIIYPPSHCPKCKARLKFADLIPVISYFMLGGKCRKCKQSISPRYPIVEAISALIFSVLYFKFGFSIELALAGLFFSLLVVISFIDIEHMVIYDIFVLIGIAAGLAYSAYTGTFLDSILGICFAFLFFMALAIGARMFMKKEALGDGDIKLVVMLASFAGLDKILITFIVASISGALAGIVLISMGVWKQEDYIPFAPFLALGALVSILL